MFLIFSAQEEKLIFWTFCDVYVEQISFHISGSETTNETVTVSVDSTYDHIAMHKIAVKENSAFGTDHLTTVSTQLGEQEGVWEREEIPYEVVPQL